MKSVPSQRLFALDLALAHLALASWARCLRPAALSFRCGLAAAFGTFLLRCFAHRALAAAAILARPAALMRRRFCGVELAGVDAPRIWLSFVSKDVIWALIPAARRSCCEVKLIIEIMKSVGGIGNRKSSHLMFRGTVHETV